MAIEGWIYFVCVAIFVGFVFLIAAHIDDDLPVKKSDHEWPCRKWQRLLDKGIVVQEESSDASPRWRLVRTVRFNKDFRWLKKQGELKRIGESEYYEPTLKLTDPQTDLENEHRAMFAAKNRRWVPMLVEQGNLRFVDQETVRVISDDRQFLSEMYFSIDYGLFTVQADGTYKIDYDAHTIPPKHDWFPESVELLARVRPTSRIVSNRKTEYQAYLQTPGWKSRRADALKRAGHRCQVCNNPDRLEVHHRTYKNRGHERPEDLTVLCSSCHSRFHERGHMPVRF